MGVVVREGTRLGRKVGKVANAAMKRHKDIVGKRAEKNIDKLTKEIWALRGVLADGKTYKRGDLAKKLKKKGR